MNWEFLFWVQLGCNAVAGVGIFVTTLMIRRTRKSIEETNRTLASIRDALENQ